MAIRARCAVRDRKLWPDRPDPTHRGSAVRTRRRGVSTDEKVGGRDAGELAGLNVVTGVKATKESTNCSPQNRTVWCTPRWVTSGPRRRPSRCAPPWRPASTWWARHRAGCSSLARPAPQKYIDKVEAAADRVIRVSSSPAWIRVRHRPGALRAGWYVSARRADPDHGDRRLRDPRRRDRDEVGDGFGNPLNQPACCSSRAPWLRPGDHDPCSPPDWTSKSTRSPSISSSSRRPRTSRSPPVSSRGHRRGDALRDQRHGGRQAGRRGRTHHPGARRPAARLGKQPAQPGGSYRVEITGEPSYAVDICPTSSRGDHNYAAILVGRAGSSTIPDVVAAAPGIRTTLDMPLVTGKGNLPGRGRGVRQGRVWTNSPTRCGG